MNDKNIFTPEFLTVFNHAKDIGWWDSVPRYHRVNRNIIAQCQMHTAIQLLAALFKGKVCYELGGNGFDYGDGKLIKGLDLLHKGENTILGDIMDLPFKDNYIDLVVTRHTLEHTEDMHVAFSEIIRVCKHDAMIYGSIPDRRYFLHSTDPALGRGICAPQEKTADELLEVIKSFKELEVLLFNTHDNNFDINFFLRVNKENLTEEKINKANKELEQVNKSLNVLKEGFKILNTKKECSIKDDCFEYFQVPYEKIIEPALPFLNLKQGENPLRRYIFAKYNPKSREDLFRMYQDDAYLARDMINMTDNYFESLQTLTEHEKNISYIYKIAFDKFSNNKDIPILDYGSGIAIYALKLYFQGFTNITIADIPHKYLKFLEYRCKKYGINIKFIYLENDQSLKDKYKYIINSEVLEHVWEPEEVLEHLKEHLDDDGILYLSTFFDDMHGEDPTHLVQNTIRYNDPSTWLKVVKSHGIEPFIFDMNTVPKGFRKIKK